MPQGVDRHALEAGPANVYFGGVSLGYLGDALILNIITRVVELHGAQAGDVALDAIVTGGGMSVDVPLAETADLGKMAVGIVNAIQSGSGVGTLTSSGVNVSDGDTVTIGGVVYTFTTGPLTPAEGEVLIGATAAASLINLVRAINKSGGVLGTDYQVAAAHPTAIASVAGPLIMTLVGTGTAAIATIKTAATLTWTAADFTPGSGLLTFRNRVGQSVRDLSRELRIHKIKGGAESTDPDDIFIFPEASAGASDVKFPFHPTQQRLVPVNFIIWPNDETGDWGTVGEEAA